MNKKNIENKINNFLQKENFKNIPFNYQRSIIIRAYEVNEDVDWSFNDKINWENDIEKIKVLIKDYSNTYPNRLFEFGIVPMNLIIERVMVSPEFSIYNTFDEYHKTYGDTGVNHNEIFPILCSDSEEDYIEDGWHRFHFYYDIGLNKIPIIKI